MGYQDALGRKKSAFSRNPTFLVIPAPFSSKCGQTLNIPYGFTAVRQDNAPDVLWAFSFGTRTGEVAVTCVWATCNGAAAAVTTACSSGEESAGTALLLLRGPGARVCTIPSLEE